MLALRVTLDVAVLHFVAYCLVFLVGLVGNTFVVVALCRNPTLRTVTNYFIASLAVADLLICIFVVPLTLMNNITIGWIFGEFVCKFQVWLSGTCVCASVYTLVAVSADRFLAICYPLKYGVWSSQCRVYVTIATIWGVSGFLFTPWYLYYGTSDWWYPPLSNSSNETAELNLSLPEGCYTMCIDQFTSRLARVATFIALNIVVAFMIPLVAIVHLYILIFRVIFNRKTIAVDSNSSVRENRIRVRVTHMMLAVIVTFVGCWVPVYALFSFLLYTGERSHNTVVGVLRPLFQWLSLANSCLNPILYASFSAKFRIAFLEIIVLPCRRRYGNFRRFAQTTMRRVSDKRTISLTSFNSHAGSLKSLTCRQRSFGKRGLRVLPFQSSANESTPLAKFDPPSVPTVTVTRSPAVRTYTVINEKYVDDGSPMSIPIFEKISVV